MMAAHGITTPLPPGIAAPDELRTRLGTLRFFDGFPDEATTENVFDNLDFQRGVQAYLLGLPPVVWAAWRQGLSRWGPANSTMAIWEDLARPCTVTPAFHPSVVYCYVWIDLQDGPLVVEVPPGLYGLVNDSWGRWVVDIGQTGPDRGQGGRYLLQPPGYDAEVPNGYFAVRPRTYGMILMIRGFLDEHGDPHPAAEMIKATTRVYPLAQTGAPQSMQFVNVTFEPWAIVVPGDNQFWDLLNEVVQIEPPESSDPVTLGMFAAVGIQHGKTFDPDERMRSILTEAVAVGDATARALSYRFRQREAYYYPDSAWRTPWLGGYEEQENGAALLDVSAQAFFMGAA